MFFCQRQLMEEMVSKAGIVKLELFDYESINIDLLIIGKPESIENFKILLDFQKAEYDEINSLQMKNKTLLQEVFNQQRICTSSGQFTNKHSLCSVSLNFAEAVKSSIKI